MPRISAACHPVVFLANARKVTSCLFIVRSPGPSDSSPRSPAWTHPRPRYVDILCCPKRTFDVLTAVGKCILDDATSEGVRCFSFVRLHLTMMYRQQVPGFLKGVCRDVSDQM